MKKIYSTLFSAILISSLQGQITQANHAPSGGDTYQTYRCDSVNISPGGSGANTLWDFTSVITFSNLMSNYTAATASNPNYPLATVAVGASPNNTAYYSSSANSLLYYGGNQSIGPLIFSLTYTGSPAITASYPMSLNTTSSAATSGSINATAPIPASGPFTGNSIVTCDGTGTLAIAGYTSTSAMRVVTTQTINFTTSFASGVVQQTNYEYYAAGMKQAIFNISIATATVLGSASSQTVVTRLKVAPGSSTNSIASYNASENDVMVYPNPTVNEVNFITGNTNIKHVSIYDLTGKLIGTQNLVNGKLRLDVSSYNKGMYFYNLSGSDNKTIKTGKLTIIQ